MQRREILQSTHHLQEMCLLGGGGEGGGGGGKGEGGWETAPNVPTAVPVKPPKEAMENARDQHSSRAS